MQIKNKNVTYPFVSGVSSQHIQDPKYRELYIEMAHAGPENILEVMEHLQVYYEETQEMDIVTCLLHLICVEITCFIIKFPVVKHKPYQEILRKYLDVLVESHHELGPFYQIVVVINGLFNETTDGEKLHAIEKLRELIDQNNKYAVNYIRYG